MSLIIYKNKNWIGLDPFPLLELVDCRCICHCWIFFIFYFIFHVRPSLSKYAFHINHYLAD